MRISMLVLLAGSALASDWWVVLPKGKATLAVRADGKATEERPAPPRFAARRLSPDGTRWTCIDGGFFVGAVAGGEPVRFRGKLALSGQPAFTPDGARMLYVTKSGRTWQVASMKPDGSEVRIERTLPPKSRRPRLGPAGRRIAYHVEGEGWGKATRDDVFVMDLATGARTRILEKRYIGDHAWSPDGARIAVATEEAIRIFDTAGRAVRAASYVAIDPRLDNHAGHFLLWRPDGAEVVCRISFLGGRVAIGGQGAEPIFGDHELFLVPVAGDVRTVAVTPDAWVKPLAWRRS